MNITEIFTRKNRLLLKAMVSTDFKLRYQQSFLGYIWSVLKPLMLFSKYVIVIASSMSAMINFGINFVVVVVFALINGVSLTWSWLLMVPLVLELYMLSLGIAFFLSAVYVNLRDLNPIWEVVMQAGFYATPIIYPISLITSKAGEYGPIFARLDLILNPVAQIVQDARHVMISPANQTIWQWVDNPFLQCWPIILSVLIFLGGLKYFTVKSQYFAELV